MNRSENSLYSKFQKIHALNPTNIYTKQEDLERFSCIGNLSYMGISLPII